jgi:hypothetical protein
MINLPNNFDKVEPKSNPSEEPKDSYTKYPVSKFDFELYKEEDDVAENVIRVKRINLPNNGDRWKISENSTVVLTLEGSKFTKKQKEFLRSVEGANWLLGQAKLGINSFNSLKKELKKRIKII